MKPEEIHAAEITAENAVSYQHQEWLKHPITQQMLKLLENHKQHLVNSFSVMAFKSSDYYGHYAAAFNTSDTIRKLITDTPTFVSKLKQQ